MGKEIKVIVGANYGDEGKGLATHYFSRKASQHGYSCLNVLYNGGCQRGHTVEIEGLVRHVFHHFGSGTFDGADTYFDKDFMVNPMEFIRELNVLRQEGVCPVCYANPYCRVSTPFDMLINRIVEESRGDNRHGSCGMGIWETEQRYLLSNHSYTYEELTELPLKSIYIYLEYLQNVYIPKRLLDYGIEQIPNEYSEILKGSGLINHFIYDLMEMKKLVTCRTFDYDKYDTIIFEGAQGLALDSENVDEYPNVTASRTGSGVPLRRFYRSDEDWEVVYVTRSYFTRHGKGRFATECPKNRINPYIIDNTNVPNEYQGAIRYGAFDKEAFNKRVGKDIKETGIFGSNLNHALFVTHLNYTKNDICGDVSIEDLYANFGHCYLSFDKFGNDIKEIGGTSHEQKI